MKRIFICAERFFPRGDAGANRVLNMAKALQDQGWKVIVLSIGKNDSKYFDEEKNTYYYDGIQYENVNNITGGALQKIERMLFNGRKTVQLLKKYVLTVQDKVLIYSSTYGYTKAVLNYAAGQVGAAVAVDVVEWHQPFQFQYGRWDIRYLSFQYAFKKLFPKAGNVIAISSLLKEHFEQKGSRVLTLPIYIDPKESFDYTPDTEKTHLIYPGNPYRKDSLEIMLKGIALLSESERKNICFHLTGVSRALLEKSIPTSVELLDMECVCVHGWMDYDELMHLYQCVDFALIGRPDNIVTRANFPSKVPELMNWGIPVIINSIGDIQNYLDEECALLISDSTPEACAAALRKALLLDIDARKHMHSAAFHRARLIFDYRLSSQKLDQFFSEMG